MNDLTNDTKVSSQAISFNFNKLQAAACIIGSAAVSVALIYWAAQSLL